jgi:hypothetical protein
LKVVVTECFVQSRYAMISADDVWAIGLKENSTSKCGLRASHTKDGSLIVPQYIVNIHTTSDGLVCRTISQNHKWSESCTRISGQNLV